MNHGEQNPARHFGIKEKYASKADPEGFVSVGDFSTQELGRQSKNIAGLLDGDENTSPEYNFGEGLRYKGKSGNYPDMKIHLDDLEEFARRVKAHFGE